ncbi:MAG: TolC family protein [Lysobacterales bacterium]|jgi:CRISPR system Cascade subunit CasA
MMLLFSESRAALLSRLFVAIALVCVAGCATYEPAPLDTGELVREHEQSSIDAGAIQNELERLAPGYAWDGNHWDRLVLFAAALDGNPRIAQSRASVLAASAEADASEIRPGPTFGLTSEYSFNAPEASPWLLGVGGDLPVDFGARREARIDVARLQARIALINYLDTAWSVRSSLHRAFAEHLLAGQEAMIAGQVVALRERQAEAMGHRVEEGSASQLDLSRILADLAADRLRAADAEARASASLVKLASAVGVPPDAIDEDLLDWPEVAEPEQLAPGRLETCREAAIVARPSVMQASLAYDQAEARLKSAVAAQYPSVHLGAGYTWERGLKKLPFSLGLALPPLDLNRAAITAAEARRQEAGKAVEAAVSDAGNALDLAVSQYGSAWRHLERTRAQAAIAQQAAARADTALRLGAFNRIDWTAAQTTAKVMMLNELTAVRLVREAEAGLEDALRQPLEGPETAITGTISSDQETTCEFFLQSLP